MGVTARQGDKEQSLVMTGCVLLSWAPSLERGAERVLRLLLLSGGLDYRNCGYIRSPRASLSPRRTEVGSPGSPTKAVPAQSRWNSDPPKHSCLCSVRSGSPGKSFSVLL